MIEEDFLTLYCDPGEDFGWCAGKGLDLLAAGTHKMWEFADLVWGKLLFPVDPWDTASPVGDGTESVAPNPLSSDTHIRANVDPELMNLPLGRIVCEDWRIYPWEAHKGSLDWDQCRTARVIGALTFMARLYRIPLFLQGANIKEGAKAAGAEELFYRPLRENRHQNDALMHYVFFTNTELLGVDLPLSLETPE